MEPIFEHTFARTLVLIGGVVFLIGLLAAVLNSGGSADAGLLESLSNGVASTFIALFSGVLIGVGATIAIDSLLVSLRGGSMRMLVAFLLSVLAALISVSAIAGTQSSFWLFIIFFSGLSSAGTFLLTAIAFALSGTAKKYLADQRQ